MKQYLTKSEVAKFFRVTERTVNSWMTARKLPFVRIGRRVLFKKDEIARIVDEKTTPERVPLTRCQLNAA